MTTAVGLLSDGPQLYRRDVAILGSTASRGNLAAYPPGKKGTIRIIAADDAGLLLSAQVVKGVPEVSWRVTAGGDRGVEAVNAVAVGSKDPKGKYLVGLTVHTRMAKGAHQLLLSTRLAALVASVMGWALTP